MRAIKGDIKIDSLYYKNPYENEDQYIWRIGMAKQYGTITLSWDELSEILNKELSVNYDSSVYRKRYRDFLRAYENVFSKMNDDEYDEALNEQKRELLKLKSQIQAEKIEYNKWIREEARDELLIEKVCREINGLNKREPIVCNTIPISHLENDNGASWILLFGDAHFGAEVKIKDLNGEIINEYNPDIFYKRMDDLLNQTIEIVNKNSIKKLYVFDLGDAIDGILRVSQLMKLRYGIVESTIKYADYLSRWLSKLSSYCQVVFRMCSGNHSEIRHLGQKKGSFEQDNMGIIIHEFIKLRLESNDMVDILSDNTNMIFENINGFNVLAYHGESKNLEDTMNKFSKIYNTKIDYLIAGHLHHAYSETVGVNSEVIRTPSIIGVDDYALSLSKTSNAGAIMLGIKKDIGRFVEYYIKL